MLDKRKLFELMDEFLEENYRKLSAELGLWETKMVKQNDEEQGPVVQLEERGPSKS